MFRIIVSLFLLGLSFGSGPCLASCGPLLLSYTAGTGKSPLRALLTYILFSLGRVLAYIVLGVSVFYLGRLATEGWLPELSRYIFAFGGAFIVLVGIFMAFGRRLEFGACRFLNRAMLERDKKSAIGMGLVIGLIPCGPLLVVFSYAALVSKTLAQSLFYSLAFGIGTVISPLALLAVFAAFIPRLLAQRAVYLVAFNFICSAIIIYLGINLIIRAF